MCICEVCGTDKNVKIAPLMTGDKFGEPPKHPVCSECIFAWYDGARTKHAILKARGLATTN